MDASGVIGAVSLGIQIVQLYGSCVQGYQTLLVAFDKDSDLSLLRCRLEIEIQRFELWGSVVNASSGFDISTRHVETVLSTLRCLEQLIVGSSSVALKHSSEDNGQSSDQSSSIAVAFRSISRKASWVLSDRGRIESMVNDIKAINDSLISLLSEANQRHLGQSFHELAIKILATNNLSKMEILQSATTNSYAEICALAALKALKIAMDNAEKPAAFPTISRESTTQHASEIRWIDIPDGHQDPGQGIEKRMLDRQPVIFEWRRLPNDLLARSKCLSRTKWTTSFLVRAFDLHDLRALELCGATMDSSHEHVAMIYRYPQLSGNYDPVSLHSLLVSPERGRLPSLNERIALAVVLAKALAQLHTCGWVHKSICSANVVFFYPEGYFEDPRGSLTSFINSPFLKGYGYSRLDDMAGESSSDATFSETISSDLHMDIYRHPSTFGESANRNAFKRTYDIYSLGVVLLEIALWKTCAPTLEGVPPKNIRKVLIEKYLDGNLAYRVGETYQQVVRTCLMGEFGEPVKDKNGLQIQFLRRVVQKLETCRL